MEYVLLVLLVVGVLLLACGLWPARRGDVPHCRSCDYNLTGLQSECCPECGDSLAAGLVVRGRRRRRSVPIVAGCLCIALVLTVVSTSLTKVNWYQMKPASFVMSDFQSPNRTVSERAWRELSRRLRTGELTTGYHAGLIDACLARQPLSETTIPKRLLSDYVGFLGDAYINQKMSKEQEAKFLEQIIQLELKVRPRVVVGSRIPCHVWASCRCPVLPWWIVVECGSRFVDGQEVLPGYGNMHLNGVIDTSGLSGRFAGLDPGIYTLTTQVDVGVYHGPWADTNASTLYKKKAIQLSAEFEVLETEPDDYVTMVENKVLAPELHLCFQPKNFAHEDYVPHSISGEIFVGSLPANVSFDVIIRAKDQELSRTSIIRRSGQPGTQISYSWPTQDSSLESIDIVLRSNKDHLSKSVDMFEAWKGELVYENIPVSGGFSETGTD